MSKRCPKVKNPCKICLHEVTPKLGLQCQGACKKWAHYSCLNYTPGKIKDIKAGIIRVLCPCPDCDTKVKKEIIKIPEYTCTNKICPANSVQLCDFEEGPNKSTSSCSTCPVCPSTPPRKPKCKKEPPMDSCLNPPQPLCKRAPMNHKKTQFNHKRCAPVQVSKSCCCLPAEKSDDDISVPKTTSSSFDPQTLKCTVENLCETVGQLACQVQELMCRLHKA